MCPAQPAAHRAGAAEWRSGAGDYPGTVGGEKGAVTEVSVDEHPRAETTLEQLAALKAPFRKNGVVTAGTPPA
ncbi:hypothetical protein EIN43_05020 [Enterobacter hormaechei]|uniref:Thiolase N-terminal domain-containing protein n=1 Tax=Enterobacter hormaechei TaxID=158836 RepID=A0A4Y5ZSF5_9ENTR|nr:hypothetical protein EIN43_05020 [Enterobacter hormaechei]